MTATNTKVIQESPKFFREGLLPCKVKLYNLGTDPELPQGHYATGIVAFPKEGKPFIVTDSIHHFISLNKAYKDYWQRIMMFGG